MVSCLPSIVACFVGGMVWRICKAVTETLSQPSEPFQVSSCQALLLGCGQFMVEFSKVI